MNPGQSRAYMGKEQDGETAASLTPAKLWRGWGFECLLGKSSCQGHSESCSIPAPLQVLGEAQQAPGRT